MKKNSGRKTILLVDKIHFIIYLTTFIIGVVSSIFVVLLGILYNNSLINYFLSLTASLVVTALFAYMIDIANSKSNKVQLVEKRKLLLDPLVGNIGATMGRSFIMWNYEDLRDIEISYANLETCVNAILDKYVICIAKLVKQKDDIQLINESFNIKQWEEYGFREIEKQLKIILDNQISLLAENVFFQSDLFQLNMLHNAVSDAKLPYLTMSLDKNKSKATVDWPQEPLSDIDIGNLHSKFKLFIMALKTAVLNIPELNVLESFTLKRDEIKITN